MKCNQTLQEEEKRDKKYKLRYTTEWRKPNIFTGTSTYSSPERSGARNLIGIIRNDLLSVRG